MKTGLKNFEINTVDGFSAHIESFPDTCIEDVMAYNEIVTLDKEVNIEFDYPLSHSVILKFESEKGFTIFDFYGCIYDGYKRIYEEEEQGVDPGNIPGMYNRKTTNGVHGIWGHALGDLVIEGVSKNVKGIYELSIGS